MPMQLTYYYTEAELREAVGRMTILIDSREKENRQITEFFDRKKIPYVIRKQETGDYSAMLDGYTLERSFVIERKHSIQELYRNLTAERQRFDAELLRACNAGIRTVLLIENTTMEDLYTGDPFHGIPPGKMADLLLEKSGEYGIQAFFIHDYYSGRIIADLLEYALKKALMSSPVNPENVRAYEF